MKLTQNMKGLSLPEMLISLGLVGGISLGVMNLVEQSEKRKSAIDGMTNNLTVEKILESYLYSPKGCDALKNKSIGDSLSIQVGKMSFSAGNEVGKTKVESLKIENFYKTDQLGRRGMAQIVLTMSLDDKKLVKKYVKEIPVPVNVKTSGSSVVIEDCLLNKSKTFEEIIKRVCEGTFGTMTKGLSCTQAIALVEKRLIEEICDDVYGGKTLTLNGFSCNLKLIHAGQSCGPDGKVIGFNLQGNVECGTYTPPTVPTTGGSTSGPSCLPDGYMCAKGTFDSNICGNCCNSYTFNGAGSGPWQSTPAWFCGTTSGTSSGTTTGTTTSGTTTGTTTSGTTTGTTTSGTTTGTTTGGTTTSGTTTGGVTEIRREPYCSGVGCTAGCGMWERGENVYWSDGSTTRENVQTGGANNCGP